MKSVFRKIVLKILEILARAKLKRMGAKVIGITGSVGKTTCKDLVYDVLNKKFRVLKNKKSFNSEFGLPLTILHQDSGFSSAKEWFKIIAKSFWRAYFVSDKYDYLVLEMGVDKEGDMDYLISIAPPDIALITAIKPAHLDTGQFKSIDDIFIEKKKIFNGLSTEGVGLIAMDDHRIATINQKETKYKKYTYGDGLGYDFRIENLRQTQKGLEFSVHHDGSSFPFFANLYGEYQISLLLPAIAIGLLAKVPVQGIEEAVKSFTLPPGRMTVLEGNDDSLIIDSTYNASPEAVKEAMKVLDFFGKERNARKIFVFGNMNELGNYSKDLHEEVGKNIPQYTDILITVGGDVRYAASAANKHGMDSSSINSFENVNDAVKFYKTIKAPGDIILAKGSQNKVRLEFFVKEFMKHPEEAKEMLVRQEEKWQNIAP